ncbi:MAG: T9SS type A sorting domain-containing protein [Ignavibacteriales bacterium]
MRLVYASLVMLYLAFSGLAVSQTVLKDYWMPDAPVKAIVNSGDTTYIGGSFTYLGPYTGGFVGIDRLSGKVDPSMPEVNKNVFAITEDGSGGWFIGGEFSSIRGVRVNNIAHIKSDKTVDIDWNPGTNGPVYSIIVSGQMIYIGGAFSQVASQPKNNLAALDITTGKLAGWNPDPNYPVMALALSGNILYTGGQFTIIGGQKRNSIASIDLASGQVTSWNPSAVGQVNTLVVVGKLVYVGGYYFSIGGKQRYSIAALDASTGIATAWDPRADYMVSTLVVSNGIVYAGGGFESIGGQKRRFLAALDTASGAAMQWDPNPDGSIEVLKISGNSIYAGGRFSKIGGQIRNAVAALDMNTGIAKDWNPGVNNQVNALLITDNSVYVGGSFASAGGIHLKYLAALGPDGKPTDWNPAPDGPVNKLLISGNTIYAAGNFTTIGGEKRNGLAAITTSGQVSSWNPVPDGAVRSIYIAGCTMYAGGDFENIGGQSRHYAAALDLNTGIANSWKPDVNGPVLSFAVSNGVVYIGGDFAHVDGQEKWFLAAVDMNGRLLPWTFNYYACRTHALAIFNNKLYAGGEFNGLGVFDLYNKPLNSSSDLKKAKVSTRSVLTNETVDALFISGDRLYVGGAFPHLLGETRYYLASIDKSGMLTSWAPVVSTDYGPDIMALSVSGNIVFAGGSFRWINCVEHSYFAAITDSTLNLYHTISGTVKAEGQGVKDIMVYLWEENNNPYPGVAPVLTDSSGHFEFLNVPKVKGLKVYITPPDGYTADNNPQTIQASSDNPFNFILNKAATSAGNNSSAAPKEYKLYAIYPNPFNPTAKIVFDLPREGYVSLKIFNSIGKQVAALSDDVMAAGKRTIVWNASGFASGVYILRMQSGPFNAVQKLVLIK